MRNIFSPLPMISFDLEGEGSGGGDAPPAAAPPAGEPTLLTGDGDGKSADGSGDGAADGADGAAPAGDGDGEGRNAPDGDADAAAAEETRRAALSDEERAEEDRRAALTDEEREAEDKANSGPPEAYDFTELLGGEDAPQLDDEMLGELTTTFREHGLTQEQANQYMLAAQKLQQKWLGEITQLHVDTRAAWRKETAADPEIGGEKLAENLAIAKKALDGFGSDELKQLLNETGIGDNPHFIRMMHNIGVVNGEHDFVNSGRPERKTSFYDHPTSQPRT